ncbi:MAG: FAD-dependent monooxygenase [Vicinamibacterales bacterium]
MVNDVAVVGGGPAGAAVAIALGQRGVRVVLYEQASTPRLKPCGEGLLPHGVDALLALTGALPPAPRVRGLRFVVGRASAEGDFPQHPGAVSHGLVVRRDRFDAWLLEKAAATPNVDVRIGTRYVPGPERMVVGADGKRSMFHRRLPALPATEQRVGLSTHIAGLTGLRDQVEVFFHRDGELYIAPTGGGEALVSGLFHRARFRRDGIEHLLQQIPELVERARHVEFTSPVLACSPLSLQVPRIVAPGLLLIGDAAGAPDPITGEGMALALTTAVPAAEAIVSGRLGDYAEIRREMGRNADRLAALLLTVSRLQGRVASLLLRRPSLVPTLLDVAINRRPLNAATLMKSVL